MGELGSAGELLSWTITDVVSLASPANMHAARNGPGYATIGTSDVVCYIQTLWRGGPVARARKMRLHISSCQWGLLVIIHFVSSFLFLHNKGITRCLCTHPFALSGTSNAATGRSWYWEDRHGPGFERGGLEEDDDLRCLIPVIAARRVLGATQRVTLAAPGPQPSSTAPTLGLPASTASSYVRTVGSGLGTLLGT